MAIQNNALALQAASSGSPLVQWIGSGKGTTSSAGPTGPVSFLTALNDLLQGQPKDNSGLLNDASFMMALSNIPPELLISLVSPASGSDAEEAASEMVQMLLQDPQSAEQWMQDNAAVQQWLAQAVNIFGPQPASDASLSFQEIPGNGSNGWSQWKQMTGLISQLVAGLQHDPENPALLLLGNALRQMIPQLSQKLGTDSQLNEFASDSAAQGQAVEKNAVLGTTGKPSSSVFEQADSAWRFGRTQAIAKEPETPANQTVPSMLVQTVRQQPAGSMLLSAMEARAGLVFQSLSADAATPGLTSGLTNQPVDSGADLSAVPFQNAAVSRLVLSEPAVQAHTPGPLMNAQRFAQEMAQYMVKNMRVSQFNGISEAKITLIPENLGQVDVRITMHNGQLTAQFLTGTLHGREALEAQMSQLRLTLQNQGIQVQKLEVTQQNVQQNPMQSNVFQEQRQSSWHSSGKQSKNFNSNRYDQMIEDFAEILNGDEGQHRQLAYGSSFHVMA